MAGKNDDRQALIDGLRVAIAHAKAICARAETACKNAQAIRALQVGKRVTSSRVLGSRGAARVMNDLERASRDLEMLRAKIESAKPATPAPRLRRRR